MSGTIFSNEIWESEINVTSDENFNVDYHLKRTEEESQENRRKNYNNNFQVSPDYDVDISEVNSNLTNEFNNQLNEILNAFSDVNDNQSNSIGDSYNSKYGDSNKNKNDNSTKLQKNTTNANTSEYEQNSDSQLSNCSQGDIQTSNYNYVFFNNEGNKKSEGENKSGEDNNIKKKMKIKKILKLLRRKRKRNSKRKLLEKLQEHLKKNLLFKVTYDDIRHTPGKKRNPKSTREKHKKNKDDDISKKIIRRILRFIKDNCDLFCKHFNMTDVIKPLNFEFIKSINQSKIKGYEYKQIIDILSEIVITITTEKKNKNDISEEEIKNAIDKEKKIIEVGIQKLRDKDQNAYEKIKSFLYDTFENVYFEYYLTGKNMLPESWGKVSDENSFEKLLFENVKDEEYMDSLLEFAFYRFFECREKKKSKNANSA